MNYSLEWDDSARDYPERLPLNISERIIKKMESIISNPFRFPEHYEGKYPKLRIGDYRALIDINFEKKILTIQMINKRGRIYKR